MQYPDEITDVSRRMEFVLLFDVTDGNPNGDPDAGNMPRVDPETMQGLVTDGCIKRKIRNYVATVAHDEPGMEIYVKHHGVLNEEHARAYEAIGEEPTKKPDKKVLHAVRDWMCNWFFDIRAFGAVMTTGVNCGQVRGPMQILFARSIDSIVPIDVSMTRVASTKPDGPTGLGPRKGIVPYGLYRAHGFVNPYLADDTGFDGKDLSLIWDALQQMWELDRSAARGMMCCRGLHVFSHESPLGNTHAHDLLDRVEVVADNDGEPIRKFGDYAISVDTSDMPVNVVYHRIL